MQVARVLRSRRVVTPEGERPAAVHVAGGQVLAVTAYGDVPSGGEVHDYGDLVLLPGLVDTHVHVNEPGRTEWEGFDTATRAAASGGVTTLLDMPLNCLPPTTTVAALEEKRRAAEGRVHVDVGFWGGVVPGNRAERHALHAAGVFGFKGFLADSGVPEFPPLGSADLDDAARDLAAVGALLAVHAEWPDDLATPSGPAYADWVASRPGRAEGEAVARLVEAVRRHGIRAHVVHACAAEALAVLEEARAAGLPLTAETCPHYLALTAESLPADATEAKCAPPVRDHANREALWQALAAGVLDAVVSDHSPAPAALKSTGDCATAWGGISSLELGLPVVWTEASARGFALTDVARWMSAGPAALAGLTRKGALTVGRDADVAVLDPDATWSVDPAALRARHKVTPYAGWSLRGRVVETWLRGDLVTGDVPRGRLLRRDGAANSVPAPEDATGRQVGAR
ncbi:MAG: allantoinase AllB [Actinomycetes bacterium]